MFLVLSTQLFVIIIAAAFFRRGPQKDFLARKQCQPFAKLSETEAFFRRSLNVYMLVACRAQIPLMELLLILCLSYL